MPVSMPVGESRGTAIETRAALALQAARHVAGLAELVTHLGGEITALVQEVHGASHPLARLTASAPARGIYGTVRLCFGGARRAATLGGRLTSREPLPDAGLDVQSALNGVFGHLYAEAGSAYALPMSLHAGVPPPRGERTLLFLHGLCMNERAWRQPAHADFALWARRRLCARTAYLRYNTGLRISHNGAQLARLLEEQAPALGSELILVGHSMGGLVARSALHQATERGDAWPRRVTHLACLGSPHEGVHLERLGNHANRMLAVTPFTRPFMRLGNLRSDGIRDLRFGHLLEADWRNRHPDDPRRAHSAAGLASHVDHLWIAAALRETGGGDPLGDWLVPVESALARNLHREAAVRRELIRGLGHLALLGDARVYRVLRRWLSSGR